MKSIFLLAVFGIISFTSDSFGAGSLHVRGYTRSDGTQVQGYERTNPDNTKTNNYSYPGNYNPNKGTVTRDTGFGSGSSYGTGSSYGND